MARIIGFNGKFGFVETEVHNSVEDLISYHKTRSLNVGLSSSFFFLFIFCVNQGLFLDIKPSFMVCSKEVVYFRPPVRGLKLAVGGLK